MYVSLEPCGHQGRTPPCVPRIVAAGIRRVVAAAIDPNPLVDGRGFRALIEGGVDVAPIDALFAKAAARLNEVFVRTITSGRPFVALKAGMTLDGRIAAPSGQSRWVTSEESRAAGRALRERYDATLVGIGTALADDPLLLPAACRIVIDPRLRLPAGSRLAASAREAPVLVYAAEESSPEAAAALEAAGVTIVRAERGRPMIEAILEDLGRRAIASVLVEGGGETLGHFLRGGYADRLHLFIAPRLLGGRTSIAAFAGPPPSALEDALALEIDAVRAIGEDLLIEARPRLTTTPQPR